MKHIVGLLTVAMMLGTGWEAAAQKRPVLLAQNSKKKKKRKKVEASSSKENASNTTGDAEPTGSLRRSNRMEFDARLIRGETAGSGAVFLFQRTPRALPSMVPLRTSYLQETVQQTLGNRGQKTFAKSKARAVREQVRKKKGRNKSTSKKSKK